MQERNEMNKCAHFFSIFRLVHLFAEKWKQWEKVNEIRVYIRGGFESRVVVICLETLKKARICWIRLKP